MITRVLRFKIKQPFVRAENPLWQVIDVPEEAQFSEQNDVWISKILPLDSFESADLATEITETSNEFQTFVSLENLNDQRILNALRANKKVQFWIDREISAEEFHALQKLLKKFRTIQLVYLPDLHSYPEQVFKNFSAAADSKLPLTIQLKLKKSSFDRWLTPLQIWDRITWLRVSEKFSGLTTQIFETQLSEATIPEEKLFLLNPTYQNLEAYLKVSHKIHYWSQAASVSIFRMTGPSFTAFLRQLLGTLISPSRKNWIALLHFGKIPLYYIWSLRNLKVVYPFRKTYWLVEYAIKTRLLGKSKCVK